MKKNYLLLLLTCGFVSIKAQTTYYSKSTATDFTNVASWGTNADGTGVSPASISNADNFVIQNSSAMTLPSNASVRQLSINSGSLTVAANTLTVSKAGTFDSSFNAVGGTLNVSGGSVIVNGSFNIGTGGKFNQSGGVISVDGNNAGNAAGSVASGTYIVYFSPTDNADINLTGGTFVIVDPHYTTTNTFQVSAPVVGSIAATGTHTFKFGDGISTDNGGTNGFLFYSWYGTGIFKFKNVILETVSGGSNRFLLVNGTYYNIVVNGDFTINPGAEFRNSGTSTSAGASYFTGNIINNGTFTTLGTVYFADATSTGSTSLGVSPSTNAQTVSGNGVFRNLTSSPTANFTSLIVNNTSVGGVSFLNANSLINGANTGTVSGTLTFTNGVLNTGSNAFVLGVSGTSLGTLSYTAGGFGSGSTFSRWYGTTGTGTTIAASTIPTVGAGSYPFVTGVSGLYNSDHFHRGTAALTTAGQMAVKFNGAIGNSSITPVTEGSLTYDKQTNANWVVTTSAGYTSSASHTLAIQGQGTYVAFTGNTTVLNNGLLVGTAQAGTSLPMGQRNSVPAGNLVATYTLGSIGSEAAVESAQSGPWESPTTWVGGVVPTCNNVAILSGHTVTVSSSTNATLNNLIINNGGALGVTGGSIAVGCVNKNSYINNNGTLSVSGGNLIVNGSINNVVGSTFSQSGGNISVDGNDVGATATSVASGTNIVNIATGNVTLTGGTMTIVDPHAANSTSSYAFSYSGTTAIDNTVGWTLKFGDGVSTDAGGTLATASAAGGFIWNNAGGKIFFNNVIVDGALGTNRYVSNSSTTIGINNLTINANGEFRMPTSGISIAGNFTNNGIFTHTASTLSFQNFKNATATASTTPQTISGSGIFRNNIVTASSTANFNSVTVNNSSSTGVTFANANSLISGANTGTIAGTLTLTTGFVNTGVNSLVLGTSVSSSGTLSYSAGGFSTGSTFSRWWPTTTGGATITASSTPSGTGSGVYPFVIGASTSFIARNLYLNQTTASTTGGKISVQYNDVAGTSTASIVDGSYTVDTRSNGNWVVSQSGITGSSAYSMAINGQNIYYAGNGNSRITLASAAASGTNQAGTSYINAQRIAVPLANLADTYYLGISAVDIPFVSLLSGDWSSVSTWNKGAVPTCTDLVQIAAGTTVTVNSTGNASRNITINSGGTLVNASGDLTVGCTANNNFISNSGTLTVTGGILNVNGNLANLANSTFNQSGGDIKINGNSGTASTSVATGTAMFSTANPTAINATAGNITIVNPHHSSYAISTGSNRSININNVSGNNYFSGTHTFILGDGVSTISGTAEGFVAETYSSQYVSINNLVVNGGNASGRWCSGSNNNSTSYGLFIRGNLVINSGSEFRTVNTTSPLEVAGSITNNGIFTNNSSNFKIGNLSTGFNASATTVISGSGVWANATTSPTASLVNVTFNNTNGITLNVPLSVSGTLTLTAGKVNTTSTNLLTLGTATAAGTLSGGSNAAYITGPFARTIATSNTSYIHYPVGKAVYAPVWLNPATTSVSNMKAEVFDSNSGTASANIANLSTIRRWEAPLVSGAFSTINVKLGESAIGSTSLPVIAPTASGVYDNLFGNTGTYVAGTPNTIQSTTALALASYTGYLSYAEIAAALSTSESTPVAKRISVYPNPFADLLTISDIKDVKSIMISDMSGKIVKTIDKPETTLRLGDLNAGMYLVILNMKDGSKQAIKAIKK